jgi:transcriptional regulator with XRE-family HTH domain
MPKETRRRNPAPEGRSLRLLGARIRRLREEAGLTQEEVGHPHLTRAAVSRIEHGSGTTFKSLLHLSRRLGRRSVRDLIPPEL